MLQGLVDEVRKLPSITQASEATGRLADLAGKLRDWHDRSSVAPNSKDGGAPIVAMTAPAGIVLASLDSMVLGSEKKVIVATEDDAEVSAGRNIFMRCARHQRFRARTRHQARRRQRQHWR